MSVVSEKKRINNPPGWLHAALRDGYADNVEAYHKQQEDIRREQHIQNEKNSTGYAKADYPRDD